MALFTVCDNMFLSVVRQFSVNSSVIANISHTHNQPTVTSYIN